jgi:NitT/TauT family transport system substrate-binding protein
VLRFIEASGSPEGEVALSQKTAGMMVSRRSALAGAASWTLAAAAGAPAFAQTPGVAIPCATAPNDSSGPMFYANELGYYKQAGLNITLQLLANSGSIPTGLASGAYAIVGMPVTLVALARDKGIPMVMIAPCSLYVSTTPDHAIVVPKNSPLRKAADLNGKTVAVRDFNNMSHLAARAWLDKNGGDSKSVHWYELPDTLDAAAMQSGRIDAASISEPALDAALQGGDVRVLTPVFDAIAPRFLVAGCVMMDAYARAHPDLARTYADVIAKTAKWANANQAKSGAILEKVSGAPVPPGALRTVYSERLHAAEVQPVLDLLLASGQLKNPIRAAELFSSVISTN